MSDRIDILKSVIIPRRKPIFIIMGVVSLIIAVIIDIYMYPSDRMTFAYIPLMIMVGLLSRFFITIIIISGLATISLQICSSNEWVTELFLLRWMAFLLIAYFVQTLIRSNFKERENLVDFTFTLAESIDARDNYTACHSENVAYYSFVLGKAMKLSKKQCGVLYIGGLLHDIGKIGIPEAILNKSSRLTEEEFEIIKQHPQKGYEMLKHIRAFRRNSILDMVLHHHEKYDGTGYPQQLCGDQIPLLARVMGVADAFDAMTSSRVYRKTMGLDYAINQISQGKQSQFDPEIAETLLSLIRENKIIVRGLNKDFIKSKDQSTTSKS